VRVRRSVNVANPAAVGLTSSFVCGTRSCEPQASQMSGNPDELTQDYLDLFLMHRLAATGTLNPHKERDAAVVDNMLTMRERGDHPSVISSTSHLDGDGGRRQTSALPRIAEEPAAATWGGGRQFSDSPIAAAADGGRRAIPPWADARDTGSFARRDSPPLHADDSASQAGRRVSPRLTPRARSPDVFVQPSWGRVRDDDDDDETPFRRARFGEAAADPDERGARAEYWEPPSRDSPGARRRTPEHADAASRTSHVHASTSVWNGGTSSGQEIAARYVPPSKFASQVALHLQELAGVPPTVIPPVVVAPPSRSSYISESRLPALRAPDTASHTRRRHDDDHASSRRREERPASRDDRASDDRRRHDDGRTSEYRRRYDDEPRRDTRDRRSSTSSAFYASRREQDREVRHELIIELDKHKIEFDADADTWELKHLLERTLANNHLLARVAFVKQGLKLGAFALEWALDKFAPKLRLKGWAETLSQTLDSGNHDATLEQVYRKVWHKGPPNVWLNIGMLIVGSAVAHCLGAWMTEKAAASGGAPGGGGLASLLGGLLGGLGGAKAAPKHHHHQQSTASKSTSRVSAVSGTPAAATAQNTSSGTPVRRSRLAPPT
jgi:hypothetical protein